MLLISIASETATIFKQGGKALVCLHLVSHWALYTTSDINQTIVCAYLNNIVILQTDITCQTAIENKLIDIDGSNEAALTVDLNGTECTEIADTACHIQGMEHSGKGTEGIGAGHLNLTHHINHNGTGLANSYLDI